MIQPRGARPNVAVLMCTYNGEEHIREQLDSIFGQTYQDISLYISDDGSTDATVDIIEAYIAVLGEQRITLRSGPGKGATANFLSLVCDSTIKAEYFAYSDQDDIWHEDKISRAVEQLSTGAAQAPALYCARTQLVDEFGRKTGRSPLFSRMPAFSNSLIQNIAGGNTMVMNKVARELLIQAGEVEVVAHDWWSYMLVSSASGQVIYDPEPCLDYRQHASNLIGSSNSFGSRVRRYRRGLGGCHREWNRQHIEALNKVQHLVSDQNREVLHRFSMARELNLFQRVCGIKRSGVYFQTVSGNIALYIAAILKKI